MSERNKGEAERAAIGIPMPILQSGPGMAQFANLDGLAKEQLIARAKEVEDRADMRKKADEQPKLP